MAKKNLKDRLGVTVQAFYDERREFQDRVKNVIRKTLGGLPGKEMSFVDECGYAIREGEEFNKEVSVYGARLRDGRLEVSTELIYDEYKQVDRASWFDYDVVDEYDHYTGVNWLSVLNAMHSAL